MLLDINISIYLIFNYFGLVLVFYVFYILSQFFFLQIIVIRVNINKVLEKQNMHILKIAFKKVAFYYLFVEF